MRPIRSIAARSAAALALTLALSGPATAAVLILISHIESKSLEDQAGNQQIEIQSFSWGPRQSTSMAGSWAKVDGLSVDWDTAAGAAADKDMVLKGQDIGQNSRPSAGGANQMSMDDSAGREKLQPGGGGAGAAQKDMVPRGKSILQNGARPGPAPSNFPRGVDIATVDGQVVSPSVGGSQRLTVGSNRTESGLPTGKRQHKPFTFSTPLDRGAVLLRANVPGCAVGRAYPQAVLQTATARYELEDVTISGCAADGVSLNYAKVKVRAWNPSKKEE